MKLWGITNLLITIWAIIELVVHPDDFDTILKIAWIVVSLQVLVILYFLLGIKREKENETEILLDEEELGRIKLSRMPEYYKIVSLGLAVCFMGAAIMILRFEEYQFINAWPLACVAALSMVVFNLFAAFGPEQTQR